MTIIHHHEHPQQIQGRIPERKISLHFCQILLFPSKFFFFSAQFFVFLGGGTPLYQALLSRAPRSHPPTAPQDREQHHNTQRLKNIPEVRDSTTR